MRQQDQDVGESSLQRNRIGLSRLSPPAAAGALPRGSKPRLRTDSPPHDPACEAGGLGSDQRAGMAGCCAAPACRGFILNSAAQSERNWRRAALPITCADPLRVGELIISCRNLRFERIEIARCTFSMIAIRALLSSFPHDDRNVIGPLRSTPPAPPR
jgi:hypothetical protein